MSVRVFNVDMAVMCQADVYLIKILLHGSYSRLRIDQSRSLKFKVRPENQLLEKRQAESADDAY